jgi:hypothetical protein
MGSGCSLSFGGPCPTLPLSPGLFFIGNTGEQGAMEEVGAPSGPRTVKDVPADAFITAFAAYLKKTNKVGGASFRHITLD